MPLSGFSLKSKNIPDKDFTKNFFERHIDGFVDNFFQDKDVLIRVDLSIAMDVLEQYFKDMDKLDQYQDISNPNVFKKMGHLSFWIRKLKPLSIVGKVDPNFSSRNINEAFAIQLAFLYCDHAPENPKVSKTPSISKEFSQDLFYYLRFKSVSPHSVTMLLNSMFLVEFTDKP